MTIQACILFLACAFYLGYFAETLEDRARNVVWSISLALALLPICALIYTAIRRLL